IEGVRYKPVSARYKVYIIDEVHMLSKNAFNALLKTLEEPPEHVKFIFATTEIRKVPVTVLSRCQRFDLRRIDMDTLGAHFKGIVEQEGASVTEGALSLISRAADGSVRDGLSLLDQAIAHTAGEVNEDAVREMLGLADRARTFDLLDAVMKGDVVAALDQLASQYDSGADPAQVLEDMLELVHWLTRIKVTPTAADAPGVPELERVRGGEMAKGLSMAGLTRAWQMLLKGLSEVRMAPSALQAAEMILVRLMYGLELPSPADVLKKLQDAPAPAPGGGAMPASGGGAAARAVTTSSHSTPSATHGPTMSAGPANGNGAQAQTQPQPMAVAQVELPDPQTFLKVVELAESVGEMIIHANLISNVHLVSFKPGKMEYHPGEYALPDLAQRLTKMLNELTARRWVVTVSNAPGHATLQQQEQAAAAAEKAEAARDPLVKKVLEAFPGAEISEVKDISAEVAPLNRPLDDEESDDEA
ncbi:MAG: DNA polymerase III subunit gamma/tau, partial [Magnetovibrio sp.]|nr:DNA polymerase III subunit gamma/tau [Magnetovibrio sp.]